MKKILFIFFFSFVFVNTKAQEAFTIKHYSVNVKVNKDASLDISEIIEVHFNEERHGIIRKIPFKYKVQPLPSGTEKANRQLESGGYTRTIIEDIQVPGWKFDVSTSGDYKNIKIGSSNKYVNGDQKYLITYRVLNAINFFQDHSELYFNLIGDQWNTTITSADFRVELYNALPETPSYFIATGSYGSKENNTETKWNDNKIFTGHTIKPLNANEGLTIGIQFPKDFLTKPDYRFRGIGWLVIPFIVFCGMFFIWKKWGKDDEVTVQTEYYPPENISPGVSGYIIDGKLNRRDLTALVPYWGAGGFLKINELEKTFLLGLIKNKDYEFVKLKELPSNALQFEKTLFAGIFKTGDTVKLSDLKNVLYTTMNAAKAQLEMEIDRDDYYVKYSRGMGCVFPVLGIVTLAYGIINLIDDWEKNLWLGISLIVAGIILLAFGSLMSKKTQKGTLLYQKLLGFKEFIKSVEKDRLQEFLKQDENYFDKVLPYAIVFDMADKWKDKLKGLEVPPPKWYSGNYAGSNFNTVMFMNSLDHSMNAMTNSFYSSPHSSGSSGGSFGGGGGFSGGGFGGGGGSSW
ncbi:MAG TPA: DUF2207 domain-containing protein [Hanamia sp.]|nr:DUF2207 domain-containing protein [Hanamia sp.]